jgi:hypothetical protein
LTEPNCKRYTRFLGVEQHSEADAKSDCDR